MEQPEQLCGGSDALIVIDVQNDFCPGGKLAIEQGDHVVPVLNKWISAASAAGIPIFFSRDFHPAGHVSFTEQGGSWPPHCLQDTQGADFHPGLQVPDNAIQVIKGVRFDQDQNSVFDQTGLAVELRRRGIKRTILGGLAQDVCVLASALDGVREDFEVLVIEDATRPVTAEGGKAAVKQMDEAGVRLIG